MKAILENRWLSIVVRVALGSVFIFSAWPKVADPPAFAHMISNYSLLPEAWVNPLAIILPWLEMFAGLGLISGVMRRGAAFWVTAMMVVFIGAMSINIARGVAVDCGCFSLSVSQKTHAEMIASMKLDLLRDIGILVMALQTSFSPVTWRSTRAARPS